MKIQMNNRKTFNSIELEKLAKLISEYFTLDQILKLFKDFGYNFDKKHNNVKHFTEDWLEQIQNQVGGSKQFINLMIQIFDPKYHIDNIENLEKFITKLNLILKYRDIKIDNKGNTKFANPKEPEEIFESTIKEERINKYYSKETWEILSESDKELGKLLSSCIISEIECDDIATFEGRDAGIFGYTCNYAIIECPVKIYSFLKDLSEPIRKQIIETISAFNNQVDYFTVKPNKDLHLDLTNSLIYEEIKEKGKYTGKNQSLQLPTEKREKDNKNIKKDEIVEKGLIFILMAMNNDEYDDLDEILNSIKNAVSGIRNIDRTSFNPKRIDDYQTTGQITPLILDSIRKAEYIIADITHERPNVFYEIGYAHAHNKEAIITAKKETKLHFDIKDYQIIIYNDYLELETKLKKKMKALTKKKKIRRKK